MGGLSGEARILALDMDSSGNMIIIGLSDDKDVLGLGSNAANIMPII